MIRHHTRFERYHDMVAIQASFHDLAEKSLQLTKVLTIRSKKNSEVVY